MFLFFFHVFLVWMFFFLGGRYFGLLQPMTSSDDLPGLRHVLRLMSEMGESLQGAWWFAGAFVENNWKKHGKPMVLPRK